MSVGTQHHQFLVYYRLQCYNVCGFKSEDGRSVSGSNIFTLIRTHQTLTPHEPLLPFIKHSYSFEDSLHLLGLDDCSEEGTSDPVLTRGAYLSLIYLRHLKLRQLQVRQVFWTMFPL